ncbi:scarecrow-like protein 34 [Miscanthus floridulus]|uniref:scarecrow-like protein 34 n=1 Tax=Miscanthus floridulus TaxID=154761 RepID=UPI00345AE87D
MSATPEDFLAAREGAAPYLVVPEPFSPSVFLDLPPTPPGRPTDDDDDPDLILPFISRMLMEEDIDDKFFYQFPDHPALLTAQQPYAQILSDSATASSPSEDSCYAAAATTNTTATTTTTSSSGSGTAGGNSTLSPSSDAPSSSPDPASWPPYDDQVDLSDLLRSPPYPSPDMGVGLDDFAGLLSPAQGQDAAPAARFHFQQSPPFSDGGGGGGGEDQRQQPSFAAQSTGGAQQQRGSQSSAVFSSDKDEEEETKTESTTFPAADADHAALASAFFGAQNGGNMDMLNMAFLKGMEEAKKFLPTTNSLLIDLDDPSGKSLPKDRDSKPSTAFAATQVQVKEEEEEQVVNAISMFGGSRSANGRGRKNRHAAEDDLEAETGRSSKLMMPEQEETGANELYNEIMNCTYESFMKRMEDLRIAMDSETEKSARKVSRKGARGKQSLVNEVVDLRTMLIHCAQSVATGDHRSATEVLKQIKQHSSPRGDATQRLAHCFAMGLEARLAGTGSQAYQSLMAQHTSVVDFLKAYRLYVAACCFMKVNFIFSHMTVSDAVAGRSKLHIVEYGVQHGFHYPGLFHLLARREGGPPEVRVTAIAVPQPGFRPAHQIEEAGHRLSNIAREMGVPFKFRGIAAKWEAVRAKDLNIDPDEVLVVNSECYIGNLMDESILVDSPSPRDTVLNNIREMRPNVFIHTIVNGTYGAPFFLTRFREALFFFSAQFDMIDATIPRDNAERLLIERNIFGSFALNVIACEGADRVERPETYKQWQVRNHRAGLRQLPLNPEVVKAARDKVKNYYHRDFLVDEDNRWLLLGWKGRVLYAMSTWVAEDNKPTF